MHTFLVVPRHTHKLNYKISRTLFMTILDFKYKFKPYAFKFQHTYVIILYNMYFAMVFPFILLLGL